MDKMRAKLQVIRDLADNCPGHFWEETVAMIRDEAETALTPPQWIKCSERLPRNTECDHGGCVWWWHQDNDEAVLAPWFSCKEEYSHWKPTNLTRPQPPEGE